MKKADVIGGTCSDSDVVSIPRLACYLSDDGASKLMFDAMGETAGFARLWVPFCKRYNIEPRNPETYFTEKIDYLKDKIQPDFVKTRRSVKVRHSCHPHNAHAPWSGTTTALSDWCSL